MTHADYIRTRRCLVGFNCEGDDDGAAELLKIGDTEMAAKSIDDLPLIERLKFISERDGTPTDHYNVMQDAAAALLRLEEALRILTAEMRKYEDEHVRKAIRAANLHDDACFRDQDKKACQNKELAELGEAALRSLGEPAQDTRQRRGRGSRWQALSRKCGGNSRKPTSAAPNVCPM